jgi:hypothetical protein
MFNLTVMLYILRERRDLNNLLKEHEFRMDHKLLVEYKFSENYMHPACLEYNI